MPQRARPRATAAAPAAAPCWRQRWNASRSPTETTAARTAEAVAVQTRPARQVGCPRATASQLLHSAHAVPALGAISRSGRNLRADSSSLTLADYQRRQKPLQPCADADSLRSDQAVAGCPPARCQRLPLNALVGPPGELERGAAAGGAKRVQAGEPPSGGGGPKRVCVASLAGGGAVAGWLRDQGMGAHCDAFAAVGWTRTASCS